jgi:hypothetical protein
MLSQIRDSLTLRPLYVYPQEQDGPVIPPGTCFRFRRLLRLRATGYGGGIWIRLHTRPKTLESQSVFTTGGLRPISSALRQAPWETRPEFFIVNWTLEVIVLCNILSNERMCLSFTIVAGPRQRSHSQVRVPRDSWPTLVSQIRDFPNLEGQVPVFIFPRNMMAWLYLQALGSLFDASYDSQSCGGGIRPHLHTGFNNNWTTSLRYIAPARTAQETSLKLLLVRSLPGKQHVHVDVPWQRMYCRLFTQQWVYMSQYY